MSRWPIFRGAREPHDGVADLPPPPPWRHFADVPPADRDLPPAGGLGDRYQAGPEEVDLVNAALFLRRPLLVSGKPGTGKSDLAAAVAHELKLGPVLEWPITTRSAVQAALYSYDAVGRLNDANAEGGRAPDIGPYVRLGPLGTALLPASRPRVLLVNEIDKGDIDLPNDLLNVFEQGWFDVPELQRLKGQREVHVRPHDAHRPDERVKVTDGRVRCREFPLVIMTSNDERTFPPAFLRRCLRLRIVQPTREKLTRIVHAHLKELLADGKAARRVEDLIEQFARRLHESRQELATDQLLNALFLRLHGIDVDGQERAKLLDAIWQSLGSEGPS